MLAAADHISYASAGITANAHTYSSHSAVKLIKVLVVNSLHIHDENARTQIKRLGSLSGIIFA